MDQVLAYGVQFGLTPTARSGLEVLDPEDEEYLNQLVFGDLKDKEGNA